jgi:hypothetical protein
MLDEGGSLTPTHARFAEVPGTHYTVGWLGPTWQVRQV